DRKFIDPIEVAKKTIQGLFDGITTIELDNLSAEVAAYLSSTHPDYSKLAARISMANLHRHTDESFTDTMKKLYDYADPKTGDHFSLISQEVFDLAVKYEKEIQAKIDFSRDFEYDYFGLKTLERSYLL